MEPRIVPVKAGWAAVAKDWAVFGSTQEEALRKFRNAENKHTEIVSRKDAVASVDDS